MRSSVQKLLRNLGRAGGATAPGLRDRPLFDWPFYQAITEARLDHLAHMALPVAGKSVIDVGCGIGRLSEFFADRGCEVTCVDGRADNIDLLRREYPERRAEVVDVESDALVEQGHFDVVLCYGLLYHLADPWGFLRRVGSLCRELLILETCVTDADEPVLFLVSDPDDPTMALRSVGCRPSPSYIAAGLHAAGFEHLYSPGSPPGHESFRYRRLNDLSYFRDGHALREVLVAAKRPIVDTPTLRPLEPTPPPPESR